MQEKYNAKHILFCLANSAFKSTKDEKADLHLHTQFICHDLWLKLCITRFYQISFLHYFIHEDVLSNFIISFLRIVFYYQPFIFVIFLKFQQKHHILGLQKNIR